MCYTYDKSKGGDTRELQSRMLPPKKTGSSHLKTKEKAFQPRKKLHQNIYLRPFYRTLKAAIIVYNRLLFFLMKMTKSFVGLQVLNKVH